MTVILIYFIFSIVFIYFLFSTEDVGKRCSLIKYYIFFGQKPKVLTNRHKFWSYISHWRSFLNKFLMFCLFSSDLMVLIYSSIWLCLINFCILFLGNWRLLITHFRPMFPFYTPWKRQKTFDFLTFSGGIEREHWPEMGLISYFSIIFYITIKII